MQNHFDKYCFAGKKQVRFRFGIGSDDGVGQMKSYKQQQDSRIIKENTLHIVYIFFLIRYRKLLHFHIHFG
jgi:hypothetical protein